MGLLVILPVAMWAAFAQTEISPTDRPPFVASVLEISEAAVEISVGSQLSQLPVEQLRKIEFGASPPPVDRNRKGAVMLIDGSTFLCSDFKLVDAQAVFTTGFGEITVSASKLQHIQLQMLNAAQLVQWQAISKSRTSGDALVLIRSEEALEKLEGIVGGISSAAVAFDFGGQQINAPLTRLAGIRFYLSGETPTERAADKLAAIVRDEFDGHWNASTVQLARGSKTAELTLLCGALISIPVENLRVVDFSSGSMQFLADLQPLSSEATQLMELGLKIPGASSLMGARKRDLRTLEEVSLGPSLEFLGSGTVTYRIPPGFSRLVGEAELRPAGNRFTPCRVTVRVENKLMWEQRLKEPGQRLTFDIPIQADARLEVSVQADAGFPVGNIVLFRDIRFLK